VTFEVNRVIIGDCRAVLPTIPDKTFHCCVTSPPYHGLRDYGTATWEGGDPACDHLVQPRNASWENCGLQRNKKTPGLSAGTVATMEAKQPPYRDVCGKCSARRIDAQLGLESTPDEYVAAMVAVFREVRRTMRDDGVLFLNLGDSYASAGSSGDTRTGFNARYFGTDIKPGKQSEHGINAAAARKHRGLAPGLKPKDLVGVPWMVAFALRADGWYLRSDIVWSKPNPMPESIRDRPTKSHEYIFLLAKNQRYYFDADAVREPVSINTHSRGNGGGPKTGAPDGLVKNNDSFAAATAGYVAERNIRSVWTIATEPYSGSHFATFPTALVTRCLLAGCPPGGVVLDPFFGSGTVGQVAERLGRRWLGVELSEDYGNLIKQRTAQTGLYFGEAEEVIDGT
jgi:DNA modification methylase